MQNDLVTLSISACAAARPRPSVLPVMKILAMLRSGYARQRVASSTRARATAKPIRLATPSRATDGVTPRRSHIQNAKQPAISKNGSDTCRSRSWESHGKIRGSEQGCTGEPAGGREPESSPRAKSTDSPATGMCMADAHTSCARARSTAATGARPNGRVVPGPPRHPTPRGGLSRGRIRMGSTSSGRFAGSGRRPRYFAVEKRHLDDAGDRRPFAGPVIGRLLARVSVGSWMSSQ